MGKKIFAIAIYMLLVISISVNIPAAAVLENILSVEREPTDIDADKNQENIEDFEEYEAVAESTALKLYFNKTDSNFIVYDRRNGHMWHSCPPDRQNDPRAAGSEKESLGHLFGITYQSPNYSLHYVDSYAYCIENGNFTYKLHPNGVTVNYIVGQKKRTVKDIPPLIRVSTYKDLYERIKDNKDKTLLRKLYSYNSVSKAYVICVTTTIMNSEIERIFNIFESCGYDVERIDEEFGIFGISKQSNTARIDMTIDFSIENDSFYVSVDTNKLNVTENVKIESISLLNNFGAGKLGEPGFIIIPDGSGALLEFDRFGSEDYNNAISYKANVYGKDMLDCAYADDSTSASLSMPMFGYGNGKTGFICEIEDGAGLMDMFVDFPRQNSYFRPYFSFSPFKSDIMLAYNWNRLRKYNDVMYDAEIKLAYTFVEKVDSYSDIVSSYRSRLKEKELLPLRSLPQGEFTVFLHTIGEVESRKTFLIFPYNTTETLTDFSQAKDLIDTFRTAGADRVFMVYDGSVNGSVNNKGLGDLQINRGLGATKGWRALEEYAEKQNAAVYPRVDALILDKPGFFTSLFKGAQMLNGHIASIPYYNKGTGYDIGRRYTLLRTPLIDKTLSSFSDKLKKKGISNIAFRDLGCSVYTSGKGNKVFSQQDLIERVREGLGKYEMNSQSIILSNPSLYALPYADIASDLSLASSQNKWFAADIPFLPILYSGNLIYAGAPLNAQNNQSQFLLRLVESGAFLQFTVTARNPDIVRDILPEGLYSAKDTVWKEWFGENTDKLKSFYRQTSGKAIAGHEILENGLRLTTYENGICTLVNYDDKEYEYKGIKVPPRDFICIDKDGLKL